MCLHYSSEEPASGSGERTLGVRLVGSSDNLSLSSPTGDSQAVELVADRGITGDYRCYFQLYSPGIFPASTGFPWWRACRCQEFPQEAFATRTTLDRRRQDRNYTLTVRGRKISGYMSERKPDFSDP